MFKKFVCIALSLMMVLCTVSVTGFAASYESGDLVASNVVFSDATDASGNKTVTAQINVSNNSASESGSAVFWVGKYDENGVLVEASKEQISLSGGESKAASASVSLAAGETGYSVKAYIWEKMIGGKAIATAATYNSASTEILYAMAGNEIWEDFKADTYEYDIVLERTQFDIPEYKLFAKDNATKITEPAAFVLGENKITVTSGNGENTKEYKLNISYKAPEFANFNCAGKIYGTYAVQDIDLKTDGSNFNDYPDEIRQGANGWSPYPALLANGTLNNPMGISGYVKKLGYDIGELFVFKTDKGPNNSTAYYQGGVGKFDGTDGKYFMSFDIEKAGTMYLVDAETKGMPNAVKEGFTKIDGLSSPNVYAKHFNAGETVNVPSYGWDDSWNVAARPTRAFQNSTIFMFGYDAGWEIPDKFDTTDAKLKSLKYVADGTKYDVSGFDPADEGEKTYTVTLPYGTSEVSVEAVKNEGHAAVAIEPETITLTDGSATATVTVTSFDKTVVNKYTINFVTDVPSDDNADLKSLEYKYGDSAYVSVDSFDAATDTYNVTLPEKTTAAEVRAEAYATGKATVEITQPVIADHKATATVVVTAADGTTKKTYTINFTVEIALEEKPNKIVNLTAPHLNIKTDNHGYQTDAEATGAPGKVVIGENISTSSQRYYDRNNIAFTGISSDMVGSSFIRMLRNYHGMADVQTNGSFTKDGVLYTKDTPGYSVAGNGASNGNFRKFAYGTAAFYRDTYNAVGDNPGWIEFNVTSDCTVVIGDVGNLGYPNASLAGWTLVDNKSQNYLGVTSYYKTFSAGDRVKIPSYGTSSGRLADKTPVVYEYVDKNGANQVYTTTKGFDTAHWDALILAVKWSKEASTNAKLSSIKVDGADIEGFTADKTDYTVAVDKSKTSVSLEAIAADSKATVSCPASVNVGDKATITVTAEDKTTTMTYTVNVIAKDSSNTMLKYLRYVVGANAPVDVSGFDASVAGGVYTVPAFEYSKTPIVIELKGETVDEKATISTAAVTLSAPGTVEAILKVESADKSATAEYKVTFEMAAKVASAVVEGTDEYKALFNDGQYNSNYQIQLADPVSYKSGVTNSMITWDEDGLAKNRLYEVKIDGVVYTEIQGGKEESLFRLSKAKEIADANVGKSVEYTAKPNFNYYESKVVSSLGSAFNIPAMHNFGATGAKIKSAMQVMTSREIAPGRLTKSNTKVYKDPVAAAEWLKTNGNYLFTVTPNTKATVYVLMALPNSKDQETYKKDGWTFLDYSAEFTAAKLAALPEEAIIEAYRTLPTGISRQWYMVDPAYTYTTAPYSLTKIQYDTGSDTTCANYPYVWYKTIDEDETLKVPTIGSISPSGDQAPLKAFILYEEHDASLNPASGDATLKSIKIAGEALSGFAPDKTDYTLTIPYGSAIPEVEYEVNDAAATAVEEAKGNVVTITVTAKNGTVKVYKITFNAEAAKTDATLKSIMVNGVAISGFAPDKTDYTVTLPAGSEKNITWEVNDSTATAVKNDLGSDVYEIVVTAQDGSTKTYKVTLQIETSVSSDATLKSLTVGGTPIKLEDAKFEYECTIIDGFVKVAAVANHMAATVTIADDKGAATEKFYGGSTAVITVKAADGTTQVYKVIFKSGTPGGIEDGGETGDGLVTDIVGNEDGGDL